MVEEEIAGYAAPWGFGIPLFDRLEPGARLALLAEVGWALLHDTESCPPLTAVNESMIAAVFTNIEQSVEFEIDSEGDMDEPCYWRDRVLAVLLEAGDADELPSRRCTDMSEWSLLVGVLSDRILWDDDFIDADAYLDMPPDEGQYMKDLMEIADDYYCAIPPDPSESELPRIRATLAALWRE